MEELKIELNKRDQECLAVGAKMKTLEEQHQDYQRHISVLKESLVAKEEHYNMLQADVSDLMLLVWCPMRPCGRVPPLVAAYSELRALIGSVSCRQADRGAEIAPGREEQTHREEDTPDDDEHTG